MTRPSPVADANQKGDHTNKKLDSLLELTRKTPGVEPKKE
jgi:hypothetical protein